MNFRMTLLLGIVTLFLSQGCQNTELEREQVNQREDIQGLQEKIGQLQSDVQSVQSENDHLRSEVARLKEDLSSSHGMNAQYQKDIERLDTLVKKLDHSREQDRKIIVEEGVKDAREIEVAVIGNDDPKVSVCGEIIPSKELVRSCIERRSSPSFKEI